MLHSPLTGSYPNTYSSTSPSPLDSQNVVHSGSSIVSSALPTFLPAGLSFSSLPTQFKTPLGSVSTALTVNANLYTTPHSSLSFGTEVTTTGTNNSLSGSSSLSSLVSLHSNAHSCGSSIATHKSCQLGSGSPFGSIAPVPRCSLWLKLQICPSWNRPRKLLASSPISSTESQLTHASITSDDRNAASNTVDDDDSARCPFPPDTCPYAHPSSTIQVDNGFVTVCYDFIKRKNCKHSCCKYYHPPAHQIEAILKRGDEQKKLLESQQKMLDSKATAFLSMHPAQPSAPNGLPGVCTAGLSWPTNNLIQPNAVYGTYLASGQQGLSTGISPLSFVPSGSDPNSLNTSALLAAAAAFQQQQQGIPNSGLLVTTSPSAKGTTAHGSANSSSEATSIGQHLSAASRATLLSNSNATGHSSTNKVMTSSEQQQQVVAAAMQVAALAANNGLMAAAARAAMPIPNEHSTNAMISTTQLESANPAAYAVPSMSAITSSCSTTATAVRAGMKREATSSTGTANAGLDTHLWYPAKRSNNTGGYSREATPKGPDFSENASGGLFNGNGLHPVQDRSTGESDLSGSATGELSSEPNSNNGFYPVFSSASSGFTFSPAFCAAVTPQLAQAPTATAVSNLLTPMSVNLYGLPFTNAPTAASPYVSPQLTPYSSTAIYSTPTDNPNSMANAAAALALSTWLQQQQQPTPSHTLLPTQVPGTQLSTQSALAAVLAAMQQQHSSSDLHAGTQHSPAFQHQHPHNQQAMLLSTLLRAQQSQLAAAQMAAAVQAAGYLQTSSSPRPIGMIDTPYSIPGTLTGLQTAPYTTAFPCIQNPITNVAYINDKGHLLETLPICRDFKAGKCHRNGDCRYVHLVDENVEVNQGRVIVCRDAAKGRCTRVPCKYYHVPLHAISANRSLALNSVLANTAALPSSSSSSGGASGGCGL